MACAQYNRQSYVCTYMLYYGMACTHNKVFSHIMYVHENSFDIFNTCDRWFSHVIRISDVKAPASLNSVGVRTQYMRCGVGRE